jgi:FkbM family methyltransferase
MNEPFGARIPDWFDRAVLAATSRLPDNWLGLRLSIGLRRLVMMRLAGDGGFDVVRWGLSMRLHPRGNGCEKGALFVPQMYEAAERRALRTEIDKARAHGHDFVFVDIGANVGLFSFFVASCAGPHATILAIEPEPENLRRLRFNLAANPNIAIRILPVALGELEETVVLDVHRQDRGGTRTRPLSQGDPVNVMNVESRPLLDVLRQEGLTRIDALKIDVEGAEDVILLPFFSDAPESLWPDLIIIEDTREAWRCDLFSVLAERGYTIATRSRLNVMMRRQRAKDVGARPAG